MFIRFALLALLLIAQPASAALTIHFSDPANPTFATGVSGIDLAAFGFGQYDVFFISGREEVTDGWNAVQATYTFAPDIYPNVANSETLSQLIKREIVRAFNTQDVPFVSGLSSPGSLAYEFHTAAGEQNVLLPYTDDGSSLTATFAARDTTTGEWGTDDLTGNVASLGFDAGSARNYWAVVIASPVPEPSTLAVWAVFACIGGAGIIRRGRKVNRQGNPVGLLCSQSLN